MRFLFGTLMLLMLGCGFAFPQAAETNKPACTDISRRQVVPCPGEEKQQPVNAASDSRKAQQSSAPAAAADDASSAADSEPHSTADSSATAFKRSEADKPQAQPKSITSGGEIVSAPPDAVLSIPSGSSGNQNTFKHLPMHLLQDQAIFWTSPLRMTPSSALGTAAFGLVVSGLAGAGGDTSIEDHLPTSTSVIDKSRTFSNYAAAGFAGAAGAAYVLGKLSHNDHMAETGFLSGEAVLNTLGMTEAGKYAFGRQRPLEGNGQGDFFSSGVSFWSEHSALAWSIGTVVAHEYPGWMTKFLAYGGAAAVSASRVTARQHFTSDVLVGSALGYVMGRQVYHAHSGDASELKQLGIFTREPRENTGHNTENMGSPYVPLDSWVYPAFDRLAAMGYIQTAFVGLRPWTRMECARLLEETKDHDTDNPALRGYIDALAREFAPELSGVTRRAAVESIYTRVTGISGQPLTDGYHFGQTIINDFGRPYQEGFNNVTGASGYATAGPLTVYVRGEYQRAPGAPALPLSARDFVSRADGLPVPPSTPISEENRPKLLDAYVGLTLQGWQITAGRQSLWWGPGQGGPMLFSDNAEPINMLRFDRTLPLKLPSIFGLLGPIRTEFFVGQTAGYQFILSPLGLVGQYGQSLEPQPYIHGQKLSFKPTANFEFSVSRTTIFGGPGYPLTFHSFLRSLVSTGNEVAGTPNKPGDRRSALDLTYRLPKLRDWLTFYADGFTDDEFSPIAYFDRSVWRAGLYAPHLPRLHNLDLRVEGSYTDNPLGGLLGHGFYYQNGTWKNGYTNDRNLIGSWISRQGQGAQAWSTYWLSPRNAIQLNYRHQKVSQEFVPGGGTLTDFGARSDWLLHGNFSLTGSVQYEQWRLPVISPGRQANFTTSLQLTFSPNWRVK